MVDRLRAAGQSWWQALPLGPTGDGNSPYQSLSSFAGNGLIISPDGLIEEGLLQASDCDDGRSFPKDAVDYEVVIPFKHKLFEKAWNTFSAMPRSALRLDYDQFCVEQAHWLDDYALFRALKARHGGVSYLEWPAELVYREPVALAEARRNLAELIGQVCFPQFLFRQGKRLTECAHARGVHLIGDLPFFASPDSTRSYFCWMTMRPPCRASAGRTRWLSSAVAKEPHEPPGACEGGAWPVDRPPG
jgi:4-alpha-glucanotransferase